MRCHRAKHDKSSAGNGRAMPATWTAREALVPASSIGRSRRDSGSARQWTQRRGVGRLKRVDVRLCHLQNLVGYSVLAVWPVNTKLNVADLTTKKLSKSRREFLLFYCGSIEVEGDLLRTDQRNEERKLKEMVFNVIGTSLNKLKKRLIQLVTALAVILLIMCILVIAGFGAGWIPKDCVIMFILSFKNRVPHQQEFSEAEEEAEDV